jgi:hypothetical protein
MTTRDEAAMIIGLSRRLRRRLSDGCESDRSKGPLARGLDKREQERRWEQLREAISRAGRA